MAVKKTRGFLVGLLALVVFAAALSFFPSGKKGSPPEGYAPFRDDALAARYRPVFDCPEAYGPILAVYYRAARETGVARETGLIHIAYHPVWARERNGAAGLKPFLSRALYTGGLSLQRAMFGKGDVESVALTIDPASGSVLEIRYETARAYSPGDFSVSHENIVESHPEAGRPLFAVLSWNHLFRLKGAASEARAAAERAPLEYFSEKLWREYEMWKNPETLLKKNRAHFAWERAAVE